MTPAAMACGATATFVPGVGVAAIGGLDEERLADCIERLSSVTFLFA